MTRRLMTLPQALATRRLRPAVYVLLAGVIACSAALSLMMERTAAQVRQGSAPMQARQVALLGDLARCDDALQHYELTRLRLAQGGGVAEANATSGAPGRARRANWRRAMPA